MRKLIFFFFLIMIAFVSGYVYWFYYNAYGEGYREGVLQKFDRKGNILKTYEGEIIQLGFGRQGKSFNAQYFYFSVDNVAVADSLSKCLGKVVDLHYVQYRRSLPWRGETYHINQEKGQYVVTGIRSVRDADAY